MDYLNDAFGDFDPQLDRDAALKLAINVVLMDERFSELASLVTEGHEIGAVEGEPGWIIRRRDNNQDGSVIAFSKWPLGAKFHAHVDPSAYRLGFPDYYADAGSFCGYVRKALNAYIARNPEKRAEAECAVIAVESCERK